MLRNAEQAHANLNYYSDMLLISQFADNNQPFSVWFFSV